MAAFWEHHHEWVEVSEPFAVVPTPYIVAPILGAGPHKEGDPVGLYITPPHSITGPVMGSQRPLMVIDANLKGVHYGEDFDHSTPHAGTAQLCFGDFPPMPAQDFEMSTLAALSAHRLPNVSTQDALPIPPSAGGADFAAQGYAAKVCLGNGAKDSGKPEPTEVEAHAVAAKDTPAAVQFSTFLLMPGSALLRSLLRRQLRCLLSEQPRVCNCPGCMVAGAAAEEGSKC